MRQTWEDEGLTGVPLRRAFGSRSFWQGGIGGRAWTRQLMISGVLFTLLVAVFFWDNPVAGGLQAGMRYWLSNPQSDWTPAIKEALETGLWLDSYDRQVFQLDQNQLPVVRSLPVPTIPVSGQFSREFGLETGADGQQRLHAGIDITTKPAEPVRAALAGRVVQVTQDQLLGRLVEIQHSGGLSTLYANLGEILVSKGQQVAQDAIIARVGSAGNDRNSGRLHFEMRLDGTAVNPMDYLNPARNKL